MSSKPTICVVIPSFRYGHLVCHSVESVLAQTRKPDQILVIDDGAHDCDAVSLHYPEVEFIERPENLGVVANFNKALFEEVKTDKVLFLGADNWLNEEAIDILEIHSVKNDIVSYDVAVRGDKKEEFVRVTGSKYHGLREQYVWHDAQHGSSLYDVKLAREAGGYAASGNIHTEEDSVLFRRMIERGATRCHVTEPLLFYRRHRTNKNFP